MVVKSASVCVANVYKALYKLVANVTHYVPCYVVLRLLLNGKIVCLNTVVTMLDYAIFAATFVIFLILSVIYLYPVSTWIVVSISF